MTVKTGKYLHYKGGEYEVLGMARHSETLEDMVVYKALYGERDTWVRPAGMFSEEVYHEGPDGSLAYPRFKYMGE